MALMNVTVKFYSMFKSLAGVGRVDLAVVDDTTIEGLIPLLMQRFEKLPLEREHICFLLNDKIADRRRVLSDGDCVTIFEMFAGG
jgi:molybdopterin converting factor small subunit